MLGTDQRKYHGSQATYKIQSLQLRAASPDDNQFDGVWIRDKSNIKLPPVSNAATQSTINDGNYKKFMLPKLHKRYLPGKAFISFYGNYVFLQVEINKMLVGINFHLDMQVHSH